MAPEKDLHMCIWLHGTAMAGLRWHESLPGLWPELPGHGSAPRTTPTVAAYATALEPLLPERFVVGGHSLGGMVAMELAARHRDRCRGLVLIDVPLRLLPAIPRAPVLAGLFGWPGPISRVIQYRTSNLAMRPVLRRTIASTPRAGLVDAMRAALMFDGRGLVDQLTMPVLSILGRNSILTGPGDAIGDTRVFDAGHIVPLDKPDETALEIRAFLERHAIA